MDDSFNELIYFPVWPLPETATGVLCNCLVVDCHKHYLVRDANIPLVWSKSSPPPTNDLTRPPAVIDRQKKKKSTGTLAV